jgi:hypothetical protein
MIGLTNYITKCCWEDVFIAWYIAVDDAYHQLFPPGKRLRRRGPEPDFSDSEVITIGLICDTYFHGHEELTMSFIRQHYLHLFPRLLEDSRFNRRRRELALVIEAIRRLLRDQEMDPEDRLRIGDSAPVFVCTYMRGWQCTTVFGPEYCGIVKSKRAKLFGFRLHLTAMVKQMVDEWLLAPAAYHDVKILPFVLEDCEDLQVILDKAYNDEEQELRLWREQDIILLPLRRKNMKAQWEPEVKAILKRVRRRVETALSVLSQVWNIEWPRARSLSGVIARIATRILAHTISFVVAPQLLPVETSN